MPKKKTSKVKQTAPIQHQELNTDPTAAIRIRMYRVGFGDCFLLSLPAGPGSQHILIDCGVHARGIAGKAPGKIVDAVEDIAVVTEGQLALVIATHAHQDHISGFATCEDAFKKMHVGEVWLPWTENPKDALAVKLKAKNTALTAALVSHFAASTPSPQALAAIQNLTGNAESLRLLKTGINGGKVSFMETGKTVDNVAGISGLTARVLGPPRDQRFLAKMDPPSDERFLRLGPGGVTEAANGVRPFDDKWIAAEKTIPLYSGMLQKDRHQIDSLASDPEGLAFALDQVMNNTSVVTLFTYRGKHLLFPGDAQYGNWQGWMDEADAGDLLGSVDFYKVAHHGSYNATPKVALEKMRDQGFSAMVSTQSVPWPSIPLPNLMKALSAKAHGVVRSDSISVANAPKGPSLKALPEGFKQGDFWFDYLIPLSEN